MEKILHKHLASVMQDAYNGEVKNIVAYSRLMNFYIYSHSLRRIYPSARRLRQGTYIRRSGVRGHVVI